MHVWRRQLPGERKSIVSQVGDVERKVFGPGTLTQVIRLLATGQN